MREPAALAASAAGERPLWPAAAALPAVVFVQLVIGALMRHTDGIGDLPCLLRCVPAPVCR